MLGLVGLTARDTSDAEVTVRVVAPDKLPDVALIVADPAATEVAFPLESMVTTDVADELHVTDVVRSCVLLSEKIPVAVNCWEVATAMLGLVGLTARDTSVAPDDELPLLLLPPLLLPLPPPPQLMTSATISKMSPMFNFICPLNLRLSVPNNAMVKDFRNIVNKPVYCISLAKLSSITTAR